jgi:AraC-like DNA-binding protein
MMLELLELLLRHTNENDGNGFHQRILDEAAAYIRSHPATIPSVEAVAARFNLSASHFRRLFKRQHGLCPAELLMQCRIRLACEKLFYGQENISEIAAQCGFNSIYSFSRAFKRITGRSPRNYRC